MITAENIRQKNDIVITKQWRVSYLYGNKVFKSKLSFLQLLDGA